MTINNRVFTEIILEIHAYRIAAEWIHHGDDGHGYADRVGNALVRPHSKCSWDNKREDDSQPSNLLPGGSSKLLGWVPISSGAVVNPRALKSIGMHLLNWSLEPNYRQEVPKPDGSETDAEVEEEGGASDTDTLSEEQHPTGSRGPRGTGNGIIPKRFACSYHTGLTWISWIR